MRQQQTHWIFDAQMHEPIGWVPWTSIKIKVKVDYFVTKSWAKVNMQFLNPRLPRGVVTTPFTDLQRKSVKFNFCDLKWRATGTILVSWHWKSHWKYRVTLKTWEQKKWVTLIYFQCDLKFFSVISLFLNNKGKYFSEIILDYHCEFLCKYFSVWFPYLFSVTKIVSVIFSVIIS